MSKEEQKDKNEGRQGYELAFHLVPSLGDDNVSKAFDKIIKLVEKNDGNVVSKSEPKLLNLEYQMEKTVDSVKTKYETAYFAWVIFEKGDIQKIEEDLEHDTDVLRYLLIKTGEKESIPAEEVAAIVNGEVEEEGEEKVEQGSKKSEEKESEEKVEAEKEETKPDSDEGKVDEAIDELVKE